MTERNPLPACLSHLRPIRLDALREAFNLAGQPLYGPAYDASHPLFKLGHQQARLEILSAILDLLQDTVR